jgi:hypothetical protein
VETGSKNLGYFRNCPKLPKAGNRTMGQNSPNLVTLIPKSKEKNKQTKNGIDTKNVTEGCD